MKQLLFIIFFSYNISLSAQTDNLIGNYEMKLETNNGLIIYNLSLNTDGTFLFHFYRKLDGSISPEENKYAKGVWESDNKFIYFSAEANDFDDKYTLDFNGTKARFNSPSVRQKYGSEKQTSLRFYESEIPWVKVMNLTKINP